MSANNAYRGEEKTPKVYILNKSGLLFYFIFALWVIVEYCESFSVGNCLNMCVGLYVLCGFAMCMKKSSC